jgi:RHH-type proline utilization regulon transcriptional repressor/proline dehydrogenase/delta 1-pyrroline-5-carboxylate dehydrogenase
MQKDQELRELSVELAKKWQNKASKLISNSDKKFHKKMNRMFLHPEGKALLIELMDQSFRSSLSARVANQIIFLLSKHPISDFFTPVEKVLLIVFKYFGKLIPIISVPLFISQIRNDTKDIVVKGEEDSFNNYLTKRKKEETTVNVNLIGEVVLGEEEAKERIEKYLRALRNPNINYISIKISTIYSQINVLDFEYTINTLVERLSDIYRYAQKYTYVDKNGKKINKFINLDMEEYRDLAITVEVFKRTLQKKEFLNFYGGIVLQAYLPDSFTWLKNLTSFAHNRAKNGGCPIKIRVVKGANMEMEATEASQKCWELVTYTDKSDTDSNYKRMVRFALTKENAPFVHIGTASHNLFELAYATILAKTNNVSEFHTIEMLEGMSESARYAIKQLSKEVITYAPTASKEQFTNAVAYLVRRLDENTGEDNFIRHSFGLEVGSKSWEQQKELFFKSFENEKTSFVGVKRTQNRLQEKWDNAQNSPYDTGVYKTEADTDFILVENRIWANNIIKKYKLNENSKHQTVPIVVGGEELLENRKIKIVLDKSQLNQNIIAGKFVNANSDDLINSIEVAKKDKDGWRDLSHRQRHKILKQVAIKVRERRDNLIGIAALEVGKVFTETDVEVSEAVDFLEFYPYSASYFEKYENLEFTGKGVGVIVPPWNFPIAIALGGISATLASGNTAIIKPSSASVLCAYEICKCFWDGGVSKNTLQFVPCAGELAGEYLTSSKDIDFVILTGGEDTANKMLEKRIDLFLTAETGGKDATIITNMADKEQAIKNVCLSAFSNSGQKCSATSLLILEDEFYKDAKFKKDLIDAVSSMQVGSVWDFKNTIGTLANEVSGNLKKAINELENGEEWAIKPEFAEDNKYMLKPSIKWGVKEGNFCHKNELFGPLLSVMRADDLEHAISIVNSTGYGLTSGIESLDEREVVYWKKNIKAGNLYINRGTTGAVVLRQPFGGMGKSAIGAGRKVGIFNYITQFMDFKEINIPTIPKEYNHPLISLLKQSIDKEYKKDFDKLQVALLSYIYNYENEFSKEKDYCNIRGEDNIFKYIPLQSVLIRVLKTDTLFEAISRILASKIAKVSIKISIQDNQKVLQFLHNFKTLLNDKDEVVEETTNEMIDTIKNYNRVIYADINKVPKSVFKESIKSSVFIVRQPPMMEGRLELLNYFIEQSISHSYHRYGNIAGREEIEIKG